jgi:hypothetical protein
MKILMIEIHERYVLSDVGKYVREGPRFPSFDYIQKILVFPHGSSNGVSSMDITEGGDKSSITIVEKAKLAANPIRVVDVPWLKMKGILESEFTLVCVYSID